MEDEIDWRLAICQVALFDIRHELLDRLMGTPQDARTAKLRNEMIHLEADLAFNLSQGFQDSWRAALYRYGLDDDYLAEMEAQKLELPKLVKRLRGEALTMDEACSLFVTSTATGWSP